MVKRSELTSAFVFELRSVNEIIEETNGGKYLILKNYISVKDENIRTLERSS